MTASSTCPACHEHVDGDTEPDEDYVRPVKTITGLLLYVAAVTAPVLALVLAQTPS
ncbi:hypothetical protein AB0E88_23030 [Streptomyces sp. NPDC028635]|uniref:hypothetical protein n=1 Tax=Streptomyces sp. NPDC028635 TaxID=3154800 RepID=UPI003405B40A